MDTEKNQTEEKSRGELLKEKLFYESTNLAKELDDGEIAQSDSYCEDYKAFMAAAKTEREAVNAVRSMAEERGFRPFDKREKYETGAKIY